MVEEPGRDKEKPKIDEEKLTGLWAQFGRVVFREKQLMGDLEGNRQQQNVILTEINVEEQRIKTEKDKVV